jgi:ABC-type uncharacterized transport system fused permease/ATPase subunit
MISKYLIFVILVAFNINALIQTPVELGNFTFRHLPQQHNVTNDPTTDLIILKNQRYWNIGLWFSALFGKEILIYSLMSQNSMFVMHLCNQAVSQFFTLFYLQLSRMMGIAALSGFIKYISVSHNGLLRKESTKILLESYMKHHAFYDAIFNSDIQDADHRVSSDVQGMTDAKIDMMNKGLMLPFLIMYYSFEVWKEMSILGLVGIYGFFIVSSIFIRMLMIPVSRVLQEKEEAEGQYR